MLVYLTSNGNMGLGKSLGRQYSSYYGESNCEKTMAVIVISKESLGDGVALAECVAGKLDYHCLSREELLENSSSEFGVGVDILSTALDQNPKIQPFVTVS
jgi:hypothetical protein